MDRTQLFDTLRNLPPAAFERLLFAVNPPGGLIPGDTAPQINRVKALLDWAEGSSGRGTNEIQNYLDKLKSDSSSTAFDFSEYLQFLCRDPRYKDVRDLYTETEVLIPLKAETVEKRSPSEKATRSPETTQQREQPFPALEGLRKYALGEKRQHLLLAGRPGSGKSTTLRRLLLEQARLALADSTQPVPIYIQLKRDVPILELIANELEKGDIEPKENELKRLLRRKHLILLLDGVNEIPSNEQRRKLQAFREDNLTVPMIFTTRDLVVGGDLGIEKWLEMRPLSEPQMRKFVELYLPDYADELLRQLKDRLREIAETPLLLKMLCDVFDPAMQQIPQSKGELFRLFDAKFDGLKGDAPVSDDFRRFKPELLRHLAFRMMHGDPAKPTEAWLTIERNHAEKILEDWLTRRIDAPGQIAKEWLEDLLKHHLLQVAAEPREIEFHHQLFQEYYAAEELLVMLRDGHPDMTDDQRLKHFYLNYLKWTEPIALMLALLNDEAQALRVVRLAINDVDLMLGASLAGKANALLQEKAVELVNTAHLSDGQELPNWLRLEVLGKTKSLYAFERIVEEALKDSENTGIVIESLYRAKDHSIENWLLNKLKYSLEGQTEDIAFVLYVLSGLNRTLLLVIELLNETNPEVPNSAICLLKLLRNRLEEQFFATFKNVWLKYYTREELFQILSSLPKLLELQDPKIDTFRPLLEQVFDEINHELSNSSFVDVKVSSQDFESEKNRSKFNKELFLGVDEEVKEAARKILSEDFNTRKQAAFSLGSQGGYEHISDLWRAYLISKEPWHLDAIMAIQSRCKFYSYEIWQESIQNTKLEIQNNSQGIVPESAHISVGTLYAPNAAINLGGTIHGDQIGTQNP